MSIIPHTNITVKFRTIHFVKKYITFFFEEERVTIFVKFNVKPERRFYRYCTRRCIPTRYSGYSYVRETI
jgi:hypothetical protein